MVSVALGSGRAGNVGETVQAGELAVAMPVAGSSVPQRLRAPAPRLPPGALSREPRSV